MKRTLRSAGADENRRFPGLPENLRAQIGFGDIHQAAHTQAVVLKSLVVHLECDVVVDARGHVSPMRRRQSALGGGLEIHDAERVLSLIQSLRAKIGNQRAGGEKLKEPSTVGAHEKRHRFAPNNRATTENSEVAAVMNTVVPLAPPNARLAGPSGVRTLAIRAPDGEKIWMPSPALDQTRPAASQRMPSGNRL